jgi:hypothetical protein
VTREGVGVVTGYPVLEDTCTVVFDGDEAATAVPVDDCRELAGQPGGKR